jgi:Transglycosylase SLT domain
MSVFRIPATALLAVLALGFAAPAAANQPGTVTLDADPVSTYVAAAALRFGIPQEWIWAVMRVESAGNARAVSSAGATGLMQIMPGTWAVLRARYGLGTNVYDPRDNIMAGAAYLREMHDRYGPVGMLAAYNAGPGRYEDYLKRGRPLPAETVAYVAKLAPRIGGVTASPAVVVAAPDRPTWTHASLFVVRGSGTDRAVASVDETPSSGVQSPPLERSVTASTVSATNQLNGLFVPLSGPSRQ